MPFHRTIPIAALVLLAACREAPEPPAAIPGEPARFLILTGEETDPEGVGERLRSTVGGEFAVERLFPEADPSDDPDRLAQMFLVDAPDGRRVGETVWDAAYRIRDETGYEKVEPDQEEVLRPATETATERGLCFVGDDLPAPTYPTWSLAAMNVAGAWTVSPDSGRGVLVCHPDTGWSDHRDLDPEALDLTRAFNLVDGGTPDAKDPLDYGGPLMNPGHGTATGSVIVSRPARGQVTGVAPAATLVPIRTARSVIRIFDSDLARSVDHAVRSGCDVISMSLGGRGFFGLESAVRNARRNNVIVLAAAGNCVRSVVAPASYDDCLAVAATDVNDRPWKGSSRGRAVDVSAPGQHVYVARRSSPSDPDSLVEPSEGTSFAVAATAGAAALWLAHHDLDRNTWVGAVPLQDVFLQVLRDSARRPPHWASLDGDYGAGIVNARSLLVWRLPDPETLVARRLAPQSELSQLANVVDRDPGSLAARLARRFDVPREEVGAVLERYGPELRQLAIEDPDAFDEYLDGDPGTVSTARARDDLQSRASRRLAARMR
ncbi:MAG TPA: S8 family serine peptidase [Gemmatimonadota bacterium]|nr:S8 family serine peptidase [Gemmatimonadota bacterium]